VRRWKITPEVENRPIMGLEVKLNLTTGLMTYSEVLLLDRTFEDRVFFLPIATAEINKNEGSIEQNQGWENN
jgi:starch-binding outer membrane protein, SusD/RagB family